MTKAIGGVHSDVNVIQRGYITVTPLHRDLTDYKIIRNNELNSLFHRAKYEFS